MSINLPQLGDQEALIIHGKYATVKLVTLKSLIDKRIPVI
jgi:hypothetical protein